MAEHSIIRIEALAGALLPKTIATGSIAQRLVSDTDLSLGEIIAINVTTTSAGGIFIGWTSAVTTSQFRHKQVVGADAWEYAVSKEALKQIFVISATGGDVYTVAFLR